MRVHLRICAAARREKRKFSLWREGAWILAFKHFGERLRVPQSVLPVDDAVKLLLLLCGLFRRLLLCFLSCHCSILPFDVTSKLQPVLIAANECIVFCEMYVKKKMHIDKYFFGDDAGAKTNFFSVQRAMWYTRDTFFSSSVFSILKLHVWLSARCTLNRILMRSSCIQYFAGSCDGKNG